jgi:hypothetical protein
LKGFLKPCNNHFINGNKESLWIACGLSFY